MAKAIVLVLVALLALATAAEAQREPLNKLDKALLASSSSLIMLDWSQTLRFRREGHYERNLVLGKEPSIGRVNTLIGLGLAANIAVSAIPYRDMRVIVWAIVTVAEANAVLHNHKTGTKVALTWRF